MDKPWIIGLAGGDYDDWIEIFGMLEEYVKGFVIATHSHVPVHVEDKITQNIKSPEKIHWIPIKWCGRLDFSRNHCLYWGPIKNGDWVICLDDLERLKPKFFENYENLIKTMANHRFDGAVLRGKRFLFRQNPFVEFVGNPHEGLRGLYNQLELTQVQEYSNYDDFFANLRPERRPKDHFIGHFLKYYFYPNSNHCLLGCEHNVTLYKEREMRRREFMSVCEASGINDDKELLAWWKEKGIDGMEDYINKEIILNDAYRHFILGEEVVNKYDDKDIYSNVPQI